MAANNATCYSAVMAISGFMDIIAFVISTRFKLIRRRWSHAIAECKDYRATQEYLHDSPPPTGLSLLSSNGLSLLALGTQAFHWGKYLINARLIDVVGHELNCPSLSVQ